MIKWCISIILSLRYVFDNFDNLHLCQTTSGFFLTQKKHKVIVALSYYKVTYHQEVPVVFIWGHYPKI